MKLSALLAPLIAAKADHATIMEVVLAYEAEQTDALERRRESDRIRQDRRRHVKSRDVTVTVSSREGVARVEDKPLTQKIEPQVKNTHAKDLGEFRAALAGVCDEKRIDEFVKLRRKKRGSLTGHAAGLFLSDAAACSLSVPEAVDTCISRNWITVKPEYFAGRARAGPAPPKPNPVLAAADALLERLDAATPSETEANPPYPRLVAYGGGG